MRIHSKEKIARLIRLRKRGHSINELVTLFQMSKTTIWYHIRSVKIPPLYQERIRARQGGSKIRKERDLLEAGKQSQFLLQGKDRYASSLLAMIYWAEGNKKSFVFTNTDPDMIKLFLHIIQKTFNISKDRIMITVRYFTGMNRSACLTHWAKATKLPKEVIKMYYNDGGNRGKSPFGICRVTIKKGGFTHKVIWSLIHQIQKEALVAQLD